MAQTINPFFFCGWMLTMLDVVATLELDFNKGQRRRRLGYIVRTGLHAELVAIVTIPCARDQLSSFHHQSFLLL
jgi:hypothetical protein